MRKHLSAAAGLTGRAAGAAPWRAPPGRAAAPFRSCAWPGIVWPGIAWPGIAWPGIARRCHSRPPTLPVPWRPWVVRCAPRQRTGKALSGGSRLIARRTCAVGVCGQRWGSTGIGTIGAVQDAPRLAFD
jgi:hypothetical protein